MIVRMIRALHYKPSALFLRFPDPLDAKSASNL
jgi:hypothetical protein